MSAFVEFTFLFAEPDEAEAFMHDCAPFDYPAELLPLDGDDSRFAWLVVVQVGPAPSPATLTAAETSLRSLARRHDGVLG